MFTNNAPYKKHYTQYAISCIGCGCARVFVRPFSLKLEYAFLKNSKDFIN